MRRKSFREQVEPILEDRFGSLNKLAGHMDISRQALLGFLDGGTFPLYRGLEVQELSGGDIAWQTLCPGDAAKLEKVHAVTREE